MRIFISAGEPSGDLHAANLIRSIRKRLPETDLHFVGYGGPKMAAAGGELLYPLVDLAVMWFLNVILNLFTFIRLVFRADRYFRDHRPDAVVLIDYPGLHWWIAKRARARGIPVFYFVPPQLWAWAGWRVKKVQKYVDQVLCSLPFEPEWYQKRGVADAVYVGHPYFDELADRPLDDGFLADQGVRPGPMVAILPGSRTQELRRNLPDMIRATRELSKTRPEVRFAVACLHERHKAMAEAIINEVLGTGPRPPIEVFAGRTPEIIRLARLAWAVSGSVGLELMADGLPSVVLYKVKQIDLWIARPFIKAKYISLVNLLADGEVFPEYLTCRDASPDLVRWALAWLDETEERARTLESLEALRRRVAHRGATDRAAERIVARLSRRSNPPTAYRGPHEIPARQPRADETPGR